MKDQGKALQAIVCLYALPRTSSSLSFRVCTRLPTSQAMCTAFQASRCDYSPKKYPLSPIYLLLRFISVYVSICESKSIGILYLCTVYLTHINLTAVTLWISDFRITNCENTKNNDRVMVWSPRKENGQQTRNRRLSESQYLKSQYLRITNHRVTVRKKRISPSEHL